MEDKREDGRNGEEEREREKKDLFHFIVYNTR